MVPVAPDHAPDIINRKLLPSFVANMLPSGNLFQNEESDFITGVEKVARLRIVRCANNIAMQFITEYLSIPPLHAAWHGLTDERKRLMAIESAQLDDFAVQLKAVIGKLRHPETESARIFIRRLTSAQ
jgi:hypothetical protein